MKIANEKLYKLSQLLDSPLYLVGGAVRNSILGLPLGDFDTASANLPSDVISRLSGTEFTVLAEYPRTGTVLIGSDEFKTEHTTFRTDSYPINSGVHSPERVEFTTDIEIDALRRDFTVNAIYYDLTSDTIVDPTGGIDDLKKRELRTVDDPNRVLGEDALRIMRLVRLRAELGFGIESMTLAVASELGARVKDISRERITDEYIKTLKGATKYGINDVSISESMTLIKCLNCYEIVTGIDYLSEALPYLNGEMSIETILSGIYYRAENVEEILRMLKLPNAMIKSTCRGIAALNASDITLPEYIAEYFSGYEIVKELVDPYKRLLIDSIIASGVPTSIAKLNVDGDDVANMGVKGKEVGVVLKTLLKNSISYMLRTRDEQLNELKKILKGASNESN